MIARNSCYLNIEDTYTAREAAEKCMMEDVIKESVTYGESSRDARMGYLTGQIAGRDASISRSLSHHMRKEYIFDPPARVFLKPYWKERGVSYFEKEGQ